MDKIVGEFFIINNHPHKTIDFSKDLDVRKFKLYEVLRVIEGVPLFLEEHSSRLKKSFRAITNSDFQIETKVYSCIEELISINSNKEGNIKILCYPDKNNPQIAAYFIPHRYPDEILYKEGVKLITFQIDRPNPNLKQIGVSDSIRDKIQEKLNSENAYDALLINKEGSITEGSKSNFFAIKDNTLYSAPEELILPGITRKYILEIAAEDGIQVVYEKIIIKKLKEFDAAFICGTSPKVLPVGGINDLIYPPENNIIRLLQDQYHRMINSYIRERI